MEGINLDALPKRVIEHDEHDEHDEHVGLLTNSSPKIPSYTYLCSFEVKTGGPVEGYWLLLIAFEFLAILSLVGGEIVRGERGGPVSSHLRSATLLTG
ncbi:hypothetical protein ACFX11_032749 [Malus domestica]